MNAETLAQVLRPLQGIFAPADYPNLLVGLGEPDDAAVWKLDDEHALVVTTDFFTPVVDDAYDFGAIAAANALSDVYAMGGKPFMALNIAAMPPDLPTDITANILRGGAEIARQAGVVIAGGHTVQDKEPKYGLVVLGMVNPQRMITKKGLRPGDALVLTKPLGFGTTTTALKREQAQPEDVAEAVSWMKKLNMAASELAQEFNLRGGTDVTGFSLLGHACEMAEASEVGLRFHFSRIPFISGARKYAEQFIFPGGTYDNRLYFASSVHFDPVMDEPTQLLLFDAQTSGGLLLAVPSNNLESFMSHAAQMDQPAWVIGEVVAGKGITVTQ
jgi:selenide,water dikinase